MSVVDTYLTIMMVGVKLVFAVVVVIVVGFIGAWIFPSRLD